MRGMGPTGFAQPRDLNIDTAIENVLMDARGLQQVFPLERPLRSLEKGHQQGIFALAKRDWFFIRGDKYSAATLEPQHQICNTTFRISGSGGARNLPSAQNGTSTCEQFPGAKGLDEIIVRTEFEANDAIDFVGRWLVLMTGTSDFDRTSLNPSSPSFRPVC